jgi:hypothetical protein
MTMTDETQRRLMPDVPEIDPRWYALAAEELNDAEVAALCAEAEASDEGRALWELYAPLSAALKERILADALARRAKPRPERWVDRLFGGAWRPAPVLLGLAVAAAALVPAMRIRSTGAPDVDVAWSNDRGPAAPPPVLDTPDTPLTLAIVPGPRTGGPLEVRGALLVHDGSPRPWQVHANPPAEGGVLVITGLKRVLFPCVPGGEWDLLVAVGRPGPALTADEMMRPAHPGSSSAYTVLKKRVVLDGEPTDAEGGRCTTPSP